MQTHTGKQVQPYNATTDALHRLYSSLFTDVKAAAAISIERVFHDMRKILNNVLDPSKTPPNEIRRVLRFLLSPPRTLSPSWPLRMLAANMIKHHGTSISSPSLSMTRPASASVFRSVRNGDLEGLKSLLESGQASIRDEDEFQASLLMVRNLYTNSKAPC